MNTNNLPTPEAEFIQIKDLLVLVEKWRTEATSMDQKLKNNHYVNQTEALCLTQSVSVLRRCATQLSRRLNQLKNWEV